MKTASLAPVALGAALLAVAAAATAPRRGPPAPPALPSTPAATSPAPGHALCPEGSLPDEGVCIPVPAPSSGALPRAPSPEIPRRPDRPAPLSRYRLPVPTNAPGSGALPPALATHEPMPSGGVFLRSPAGSEVTVPSLEHQRGKADLLTSAALFGNTAVTRHRVVEGGEERQYVVFLGNLRALPDPHPRPVSGVVGEAGTQATAGVGGLYLEVRRARSHFQVEGARVDDLRRSENTVSVDPRNVLPRR